ncbi:hypothetical protein HK098_005157 [Nowakowskiella sp. JEL0407]|nr:hypothetical protein HK098_005157 [Nowakowskiella sp. JEL0407]
MFTWTQPWSIVAEYPKSGSASSGDSKPVLKLHSLVTDNYLKRFRPLGFASYVPAFRTLLKFNPADYVGASIIEMDNQPAIPSVIALANSLGLGVKDENARFNGVLSSLVWINGKFVIGDGSLARQIKVPKSSSRSYKLQLSNGTITTLDVPWFMVKPISTTKKPFTDRQSFYQSFCAKTEEYMSVHYPDSSKPSLPNNKLKRSHETSLTPPKFKRSAISATVASKLNHEGWYFNPRDHDFGLEESESFTAETISQQIEKLSTTSDQKYPNFKFQVTNDASPIMVDNNTGIYTLNDKKTGVWLLPTFLPAGQTLSNGTRLPIDPEERMNWLKNLTAGLTTLQKQNYTNLIIDVSQNGGGLVCFEYLFLQLLFPDIQFSVYDARRSELLTTLATASLVDEFAFMYNPANFASMSSTSNFAENSTDWIKERSPGPTGYLGSYTQQFKFISCDPLLKRYTEEIQKAGFVTGFWNPANITILTDGNCGSACGNFTRALAHQKNVKIFVCGGPVDVGSGRPSLYSAFERGIISDSSDIRYQIKTCCINYHPRIPMLYQVPRLVGLICTQQILLICPRTWNGRYRCLVRTV